MPSPFPGMDPYLERPAWWPSVHFWVIAGIADELRGLLPQSYLVSVEERVYVASAEDEWGAGGARSITPDLTISADALPLGAVAPAASTAVLPIPVLLPTPQPVRERFLEIRDLRAGEDVVTVLKVLSPANKRPGAGRDAYLSKRDQVISSRTNLVEIDLLRANERMPLLQAPPPLDYSVCVARAERSPRAELYRWSLKDPLPVVHIPLRQGEPDVELSLAHVLAATYERGDFGRRIDYSAEPDPPLRREDAEWATGLLAERGLR